MFISSPSPYNMFGLKPEMSSHCHHETILHLSETTSTNVSRTLPVSKRVLVRLDVNITVKEVKSDAISLQSATVMSSPVVL